MSGVETCPGCGGAFEQIEGPIHAYMTSSPACWAAFGRLMAAEYEQAVLMAVHRLSVDAFAVQHPGDPADRRAVQSVGLHLARLYHTLRLTSDGIATNRPMLDFTERKADLPQLAPPPAFAMTMADVEPAIGGPDHAATVRRWAASALDDWTHAHDEIARFIGG